MMMKLRRMWIQLTADRKRFGALCAVLLVAMLLWSRLIVVSRMPRMAIAEDEKVVSAKEETASRLSSHADEQARRLAPLAIELTTRPHHDPFVISPNYFPKPSLSAESAADQGKSTPEPVEETYQIEARLTAAMTAIVERLRLEAVVSGSLAIINGKTHRAGDVLVLSLDSVASDARHKSQDSSRTFEFRLEEVKYRSAVLECEGRRFEVQMASPGG